MILFKDGTIINHSFDYLDKSSNEYRLLKPKQKEINMFGKNKDENQKLYKAYSIRDSKGECFNLPFYQKTHGHAERHFETAVNDERSQLNKYPKDFDLYHVGYFNEDNGMLTHQDPVHIISAIELWKEPKEFPYKIQETKTQENRVQ